MAVADKKNVTKLGVFPICTDCTEEELSKNSQIFSNKKLGMITGHMKTDVPMTQAKD